MKRTLMLLVTLALIVAATAAHAQRGPCQPTPFNPGGCSYRSGYGFYGGWDPYPGTRSGGQDAVNYASATAIGLPAVVGALGALVDIFTPSTPQPVAVAEPVAAPAAVPGHYGGNQCVWRRDRKSVV